MQPSSKFDAQAVAPEVSTLIRARLDAYVQAHDADELSAGLAALCAEHPAASWEVLALLDQYHRRGHLSTELFQTLKAEAHQRVFGSAHTGDIPEPEIAPDGLLSDDPDATVRVTFPGEVSERRQPRDAAPGSTASERRPPRDTAPPIRPGTVLRDRYVIENALGQGEASRIFKALDRHRMDRPPADRYVAVKVPRDEFSADPGVVLALQDEFWVAESLSHPNIVNVFDLDHDGDRHFITMELLEGELLSEVIDRMHPRLLSLAQVLGIARDVGAALQYAHDRGVVHADLRPDNIMITRTEGVRVLGFGVTTSTSSGAFTARQARRLTSQPAKPSYASRERLRGWEPDPRDDLYSLACITYELLSGQRPLSERQAASAYAPRIHLRRAPGLTRQQWSTLRRGLAPLRQRRPRTVREWLDGMQLLEGAHEHGPRRAMDTKPRGSWWSSIAVSVLVLAGVLAFFVYSGTGPFRDLPSAIAAREFMRGTLAPILAPEVAADRSTTVPQSQPREPAATDEPAVTDAGAPPDVPAPQEEAGAPDVAAPEEGAPPVETPMASPTEETNARQEPPAPPASMSSDPQASKETASELTPPASEAMPELAPPPSETIPAARGPGRLTLAQESYSIGEGATVVRLTVRREGGNDGEVEFRWRTIGSSATPGEDFVAFEDAHERLEAGQQTAVLFTPLMSDALAEHTEIFYVEIDDPRGGATLGPVTRTTVIILDDD